MQRIFIALKIKPENNLLRLHSTLKSLLGNEKINWVDPGNIHLTLVFLGDTEEERIKMAAIMLKQRCTGFGEFDFNLSGTGVFKDFRDPRVIWIGIEDPGKLAELYNTIKTGLEDTGFKTEERPFKPHITIARIKFLKHPEILRSVIDKYRDSEIQKVPVKEVILYESILKPTGPVYKPMGIFRL
ncbi:MAG TPA: RNA 2',3'-cyclic phosphodiesterase [Bacteroidales bacterium]|nr:RNA 2',3'-cyclic phosphodiesterase [Bacteroidales bacterium]